MLFCSWLYLASVLSEILASFLRLASRRWIIFEDPQPSCPSIPLRGSCHKINITSGGASLAYLWWHKIEGYLQQSSHTFSSGNAPVMTWYCWAAGIESVFALITPRGLRPRGYDRGRKITYNITCVTFYVTFNVILLTLIHVMAKSLISWNYG